MIFNVYHTVFGAPQGCAEQRTKQIYQFNTHTTRVYQQNVIIIKSAGVAQSLSPIILTLLDPEH